MVRWCMMLGVVVWLVFFPQSAAYAGAEELREKAMNIITRDRESQKNERDKKSSRLSEGEREILLGMLEKRRLSKEDCQKIIGHYKELSGDESNVDGLHHGYFLVWISFFIDNKKRLVQLWDKLSLDSLRAMYGSLFLSFAEKKYWGDGSLAIGKRGLVWSLKEGRKVVLSNGSVSAGLRKNLASMSVMFVKLILRSRGKSTYIFQKVKKLGVLPEQRREVCLAGAVGEVGADMLKWYFREYAYRSEELWRFSSLLKTELGDDEYHNILRQKLDSLSASVAVLKSRIPATQPKGD